MFGFGAYSQSAFSAIPVQSLGNIFAVAVVEVILGTDSLSASNSTAVLKTTEASPSTDSLSASNSYAVLNTTEVSSNTDSLSASNSYAVLNTTEVSPSIDSIFGASSAAALATTEVSLITDILSNTAVFAPTIIEPGLATDSQIRSVIFYVAGIDTVSLSDSLVAGSSNQGSTLETLSAVDNQTSIQAYNVVVIDSSLLLDSPSATYTTSTSSLESTNATDSATQARLVYALVSESGQVFEINAASNVTTGVVAESGNLSDSVIPNTSIYFTNISEPVSIADLLSSTASFVSAGNSNVAFTTSGVLIKATPVNISATGFAQIQAAISAASPQTYVVPKYIRAEVDVFYR